MMLISVIPEISSYAVAVPGTPGKATEVRVYDGNGDRLLATVTPFPGHQGSVSVAMGDVDDDGVYDLLVGAGKDHAPEVVVYSGKAKNGKNAFATELARFRPFTAGARGGVSVTAAQIDGTSADNIVVASGPGIASEVRVYSSKLPSSPGTAPALFSTFSPYAGDRSGVSLTTGFVDYATGRYSIVTAPGPGTPAEVKVFAFPLLKPISNGSGHAADHAGVHAAGPSQPANTASFKPFGDAYQGGVSLATGWLAGSLGGAERIVVSQLEDAGTVKVFSSGSALDDGPALYLQSPNAHGHPPTFREIASFNPFDGTSGTRVATTSTTDRSRPAGQRRAGPQRERREVRVRQAERPGDSAASPASRRSLFRGRIATSDARRGLDPELSRCEVARNRAPLSHRWSPPALMEAGPGSDSTDVRHSPDHQRLHSPALSPLRDPGHDTEGRSAQCSCGAIFSHFCQPAREWKGNLYRGPPVPLIEGEFHEPWLPHPCRLHQCVGSRRCSSKCFQFQRAIFLLAVLVSIGSG